MSLLPVEPGQKLLSLLFPRALLGAHPFEFFKNFACILVLPTQGNEERLLLGKLPFTLDDFALDTSQLVIERFGVYTTRVHLPCHPRQATVGTYLHHQRRPRARQYGATKIGRSAFPG